MDPYSSGPSKQSPAVRGAVVAGLIVMVAAVAAWAKRSDGGTVNQEPDDASGAVKVVSTPTPATTAATKGSPAASAATATSTAAVTAYKDGTYQATGSYSAPSGTESVVVQLTLANDIVTAVTVTGNAEDRQAAEYQQRFISGIGQIVVGKPIANLSVSRVSGSSFTSGGFNKAVAAIREKAKF